MKKIFKRLTLLFMILSLFITSISLNSISVYGESKAKKTQKSLGISDDTYKVWLAVWDAYKASGLSDSAIAGIFGNLYCESSFNGACVESGSSGQGIGIAQWSTTSNQQALQNWSKKCGHKTKSVTCSNGTYTICTDVACQSAFLLTQLKGSWISTFVKKYNKVAKGYKKDKVPQNIDVYDTFKKYKKAKDEKAAAIAMFDCYERGAGINILNGKSPSAVTYGKTNAWWFIHEHTNRPTRASQMMTIFEGKSGGGSSGSSTNKSKDVDKKAAQTIANGLVNAGLWSEEEFDLYCSLTEVDLEFPERDNLSKDQLKGVSDWKNNIDYENEDGILKFIRVVVMLMGILFLVWMLFIYLCYWMDRINNFVDIDFLPMITGGRLRVSPEEHECTFNPKNFVKGQPQTVNHRAVLSICLIGIFFAVLVITGKLYDVINFIVRKILGWLGLV